MIQAMASRKKKLAPAGLCLILLSLFPVAPHLRAWSDHGSLLWPQFADTPALLEASLSVETLDAFIDAEAEALEKLLAMHESSTRASLPVYAPRPDAIAFSAHAPDRRRAFLEAIRVNPTLAYAPYRQRFAGEIETTPGVERESLGLPAMSGGRAAIVYVPLEAGARVSPAQVVASASDEPDFGIDIGLFEDNDTTFGVRYGFGVQPFGNPNLPYSSQAPFHMGFYHLDWLTRTVQRVGGGLACRARREP